MEPRVLLVEDMDDSIEILEEYLKLLGTTIVGKAKNGKVAVELYRKLKPDIVLIDIFMPKYDGIYAFRNIQDIDSKAKLIMMTGSYDENTEQKLLSMGAIAIIYKPFDGNTIKTIIEKVKTGEKSIPN